MERRINTFFICILLFAYLAIIVGIAIMVGFEEKGSIIGYLIGAAIIFMPFGSLIYSIRRKEEYKNRHRSPK